jgi:hypothetical protein
VSKTFYCYLVAALAGLVSDATAADQTARLLGANSCASSGCHGGGGGTQNQFLVWSVKDFHSQRPAATLTTARAKQIADALEIKDATTDSRCTTCHAPVQDVPPNLRGDGLRVSEGVTCESCHGPSENWIRAHTRPDYTRADRTAAGMRDLENLYVRANTCVACHQNVAADLLQAGHPELMFELDGQGVAEPRHWSAARNGNGAQAWLVGQAAALREMSWEWSRDQAPAPAEFNRWAALVWLLQTALPDSNLKTPPVEHLEARDAAAGAIQSASDGIARDSAAATWTDDKTRAILNSLAGTGASFRDATVAQPQQARRAERLVLGLDRLVAALPELKSHEPLQSALNELFAEAQSLPDFDPARFADTLDKFHAALP